LNPAADLAKLAMIMQQEAGRRAGIGLIASAYACHTASPPKSDTDSGR
jgi:hypothetical protein